MRDLVSRARYRVPLAVGGVVLLAVGQVVWNASASAYPGVGDITEYYIPTAHSLPKGIAAGPDGNLVHRVANADLLTGTSGYNQDIGIFVSDNGGVDTLLAWKESGGFAGTFSPNAAFVQTSYPMTAGHTYVFKLKWKTNKNASGATIYAAAGGPPEFSPTRLTVELTDPPPPPTLISDGINNAFASAIGLGTVGCGGSAARSGTTYPGGTEDWFVFTWSVGPAGCTHAGLTLTATSGIQADINTDATTTILSSATGPTVLTTSGTFYVRVYGASTGDIGTWVIVIATFQRWRLWQANPLVRNYCIYGTTAALVRPWCCSRARTGELTPASRRRYRYVFNGMNKGSRAPFRPSVWILWSATRTARA